MESLNFMRPEECNDLGEEWVDYYLDISNIKKGETFYECYYDKNIKLIAIEDAKRLMNGWYCKVQNTKNEVVELYVSATTKGYPGPNLFRAPQYLEYDEKEGYIYPII